VLNNSKGVETDILYVSNIIFFINNKVRKQKKKPKKPNRAKKLIKIFRKNLGSVFDFVMQKSVKPDRTEPILKNKQIFVPAT
jgi:hypothetical protein